MDNRDFLNRYRLSLGRNGLPVELHRSPTARTYRAQEIESGREVALTLVSPAPSDPALLEQLKAGATAAEKINQINIPRLYDFGRERDDLIYASEYCEGHTAAAWVAARGPLSIGAVLRAGLQIVDAMNATAFQRLYHPALNPDNIIFVAGQTVEGEWPPVKVLHWFALPPDFSAVGDTRVDSAARFAAPEQLHEGKVDVRSEIYALGATMWFLLTGAAPAAAGSSEAPPELTKLRGAPKIVRHLLERMLRPDPAERPQDPVALAAYLQTCLARVERREKIERRLGIPVMGTPRTVEQKPRAPFAMKPWAIAAALVALAALAALIVPWSVASKRPARVAEKTNSVPATLPNEVPVVTKDSLGRIDANDRFVPPAPEAADESTPSEIPRDESATIAQSAPVAAEPAPPAAEGAAETAPPAPPAPVGAPSDVQRDASTTADANIISGAAEPAAPEEGPATIAAAPAPPPASSTPEIAPGETGLSGEPDIDTTAPAPIVAETNEAHSASDFPTPAEPSPIGAEQKFESVDSTAHREKNREPVVAKRSATKTKSVAQKSTNRSSRSRKDRRVTRAAKRAKPLPKLRVGSARAELVGTTSDGRWILSVAETGKRVIVPPPPGYGQ